MKKPFLLVFAVLLAGFSFGQKGNGTNTNVFSNPLYVRIGYGSPGEDLKSEKVLTAGAQFELGSIFYINAVKLPEKLKLGIDATFLSFSGLVNRDSLSKNNKTNSYFTAGVKLGPCLSYNFAGHWIADAFIKFHPQYFITGEHDKYDAATQFKLGSSMGINIRYKALMIGCEFTSAKYDFDVATTTTRTALETTSKTIKLPVTFISLGVNL
ncbi:MAG: hypothetical protein WCR72_01545 [Bacteroidota bacterium]